MRFRIHFTRNDGSEDAIDLEGSTAEEIRRQADEAFALRGEYGRAAGLWEAAKIARTFAPSESVPSITDTYKAKIERDAATMKVLRMLLGEAHDFLNAQVVLTEDYDDWEKRYKAFTESLDRIAAGVALVTDTRLGGD